MVEWFGLICGAGTWLEDDLSSSKLNTSWVTNQCIAETLLQIKYSDIFEAIWMGMISASWVTNECIAETLLQIKYSDIFEAIWIGIISASDRRKKG
jgi:hypothetical protein